MRVMLYACHVSVSVSMLIVEECGESGECMDDVIDGRTLRRERDGTAQHSTAHHITCHHITSHHSASVAPIIVSHDMVPYTATSRVMCIHMPLLLCACVAPFSVCWGVLHTGIPNLLWQSWRDTCRRYTPRGDMTHQPATSTHDTDMR